jgi:hypothetical protein
MAIASLELLDDIAQEKYLEDVLMRKQDVIPVLQLALPSCMYVLGFTEELPSQRYEHTMITDEMSHGALTNLFGTPKTIRD